MLGLGCFHRKRVMSLGQHFPRDRSAPAHRPGGGWSEGTAARSGASAGTTCGPRGPSPRLPAMRKLPACLDVHFWKAGVPSCPSAVDGRSPRGLSTPETACTQPRWRPSALGEAAAPTARSRTASHGRPGARRSSRV